MYIESRIENLEKRIDKLVDQGNNSSLEEDLKRLIDTVEKLVTTVEITDKGTNQDNDSVKIEHGGEVLIHNEQFYRKVSIPRPYLLEKIISYSNKHGWVKANDVRINNPSFKTTDNGTIRDWFIYLELTTESIRIVR